MTNTVRLLAVVAVSFAVWGDYYLKRFSDGRGWQNVVWCMLLWELCAIAWVCAYAKPVSLGRTTVFGAALTVLSNQAVAYLVFGERPAMGQWLGVGLVIGGIVLVGS